jgi:hypothetical protein
MMGPARRRIAEVATLRNMVLRAAGHGTARVPQCETEGRPDPIARRAYLAGVPYAMTRSDRTMVVRGALSQRWWAVTDTACLPRYYTSKAAALAAGRAAETAADARLAADTARAQAMSDAMSEDIQVPPLRDMTAWMRTPEARAWMRWREVDRLTETVSAQLAGYEIEL